MRERYPPLYAAFMAGFVTALMAWEGKSVLNQSEPLRARKPAKKLARFYGCMEHRTIPVSFISSHE